ncbi:ABC transporter permease [Pelagibacterium lacus]|uniref:ABC transporter permease n=2 Tax=Pelagibacterium lacus TaxID=2282655 RepID=A0A369W8E2_9HYPH|nr:ABC transporter permease [Pelagibacterium lacus]
MLLPFAGVAIFVVAFEAVVRLGVLPQRFFPPPSVMVWALSNLITQPEFHWALWNTLSSWAAALLLAAVFALPIGFAMGASPLVYSALRLTTEFLRPIPSVALIPAAILLIGANVEAKIYLAAFSAFWPILIQTVYGMRDIDPTALETARSFRIGRGDIWTRIMLPSASPYIGTGLRIASAVALIIVVTMEIVVGIPGIGLMIINARQGANVPNVYALILASGLLGWALNTMFAVIEARLLHWHPSYRSVTP